MPVVLVLVFVSRLPEVELVLGVLESAGFTGGAGGFGVEVLGGVVVVVAGFVVVLTGGFVVGAGFVLGGVVVLVLLVGAATGVAAGVVATTLRFK